MKKMTHVVRAIVLATMAFGLSGCLSGMQAYTKQTVHNATQSAGSVVRTAGAGIGAGAIAHKLSDGDKLLTGAATAVGAFLGANWGQGSNEPQQQPVGYNQQGGYAASQPSSSYPSQQGGYAQKQQPTRMADAYGNQAEALAQRYSAGQLFDLLQRSRGVYVCQDDSNRKVFVTSRKPEVESLQLLAAYMLKTGAVKSYVIGFATDDGSSHAVNMRTSQKAASALAGSLGAYTGRNVALNAIPFQNGFRYQAGQCNISGPVVAFAPQ